MGKQHLARLTAPRLWQLSRKEHQWTARPRPGPHKLSASITLNYLLRTMLRAAKTAKEVKLILNKDLVLVNYQVRKDYKFPIGFMDVIQLPTLHENYRLLYDHHGYLRLHPINEEETTHKILKITGKILQKKGKIQINLHDGRNFLTDHFAGNPGDSLLIDLTKKTPPTLLKLAPGNLLYFTGGSYIGRIGKLLEVIRKHDLEEPKIRFTLDNAPHETLLRYCLVVGTDKPIIQLIEP